MFSFVTCTWNPLGGECLHRCTYCWARKLAVEKKMMKYQGKPYVVKEELKRRFKPGDFVFVSDMLDLFGDWVLTECISDVFNVIRGFPETQFLFLTKNPKRYFYLEDALPQNCVLGCTIESNENYCLGFSPSQTDRLRWMEAMNDILVKYRRFISVEPILNFDVERFANALLNAKPWAVAVGYDNYGNKLEEPPLAKTLLLIEILKKAGIKVYKKTLRERWNQ